MPYAFYLGIAFSTDEDGTLTLIEKTLGDQEIGEAEVADEVRYHIRRMQGLSGKDAEQIAAHISSLLTEEEYVGRSAIALTVGTSRGEAVRDALLEEGLTPTAVVVTGESGAAAEPTGSAFETPDGHEDFVTISERSLVTRFDEMMHDAKVDAPNAPDAPYQALTSGLQAYRKRVGETGAEGAEPGSENFDEPAQRSAVLSSAIAAWMADERTFDPTEHLTDIEPTTGEAKRDLRPDTTN